MYPHFMYSHFIYPYLLVVCLVGLLVTADACSSWVDLFAHSYNITNPIVRPYNILDRYAWEWRETRELALVFPAIVITVQGIGNNAYF